MRNYVLVTPVKDEAAYVSGVIRSIALQSLKPVRWVIVSDASTDGTDDIVRAAGKEHGFIRFIRVEKNGKRSFGSKAAAFSEGYRLMGDLSYGYIGNLDADITLLPDYYRNIIEEMCRNPLLGVASGVCCDKTPGGFKRTVSSLDHAVGARSFERFPVYHHKPVDSVGGRRAFHIAYRAGMTEYHIGTHPLMAVAKACRRLNQPPLFLGLFVRLWGYCRLWLAGVKRDAPSELVDYLKRVQVQRLRDAIFRMAGRRGKTFDAATPSA
jgi:biofilm PGA synthesis N-glycosyltransferase PgaC